MEIHNNNGIKRGVSEKFAGIFEGQKVVVVDKLKGLYLRFSKTAQNGKLLVGAEKTKIDKDICRKLVSLYNLDKCVENDSILYCVVYGKGISRVVYDSPESFIARFYNRSEGNEYMDWLEFEEFCVSNNLPIISVKYYGVWKSEYAKEDIIARLVEKTVIFDQEVDTKLFWKTL